MTLGKDMKLLTLPVMALLVPVDKFTYLGSSVASTEKDIDTRLTKAWTAINRLSIIWKSDLTDKMKGSGHINTAIWVHYMAATPHKTPTVRPPASYH